MKSFLIGLAVVAAALAILLIAGPRVPVDATISIDVDAIGENVDAWLAAQEAEVSGLREGLAKEIVWNDPQSRARTPLALVYIHGFSASKGEIRPVPDMIAAELGANLFYTRLTGHGRGGTAMAEATVNDWINDMAEALAIGKRIGERTIVIATSTGAALATWAAAQPEFTGQIAGMALISPNYGVQASGSWLLTLPWGGLLSELIIGEERGFEPLNEQHARYWTTRYPTSALLPMAALTELARETEVETIDAPALFIFSADDKIVRPALTREIAARWGAPTEMMIVEGSDDPFNHVIAGDALSPSTTALVAGRITQWISALSD